MYDSSFGMGFLLHMMRHFRLQCRYRAFYFAGWAKSMMVEILILDRLTFVLFLFLFFECQVSGVSVQDILLCPPFLTPDT
jgi:hypothetical protein